MIEKKQRYLTLKVVFNLGLFVVLLCAGCDAGHANDPIAQKKSTEVLPTIYLRTVTQALGKNDNNLSQGAYRKSIDYCKNELIPGAKRYPQLAHGLDPNLKVLPSEQVSMIGKKIIRSYYDGYKSTIRVDDWDIKEQPYKEMCTFELEDKKSLDISDGRHEYKIDLNEMTGQRSEILPDETYKTQGDDTSASQLHGIGGLNAFRFVEKKIIAGQSCNKYSLDTGAIAGTFCTWSGGKRYGFAQSEVYGIELENRGGVSGFITYKVATKFIVGKELPTGIFKPPKGVTYFDYDQ